MVSNMITTIPGEKKMSHFDLFRQESGKAPERANLNLSFWTTMMTCSFNKKPKERERMNDIEISMGEWNPVRDISSISDDAESK
jgi:hypothetical protein